MSLYIKIGIRYFVPSGTFSRTKNLNVHQTIELHAQKIHLISPPLKTIYLFKPPTFPFFFLSSFRKKEKFFLKMTEELVKAKTKPPFCVNKKMSVASTPHLGSKNYALKKNPGLVYRLKSSFFIFFCERPHAIHPPSLPADPVHVVHSPNIF